MGPALTQYLESQGSEILIVTGLCVAALSWGLQGVKSDRRVVRELPAKNTLYGCGWFGIVLAGSGILLFNLFADSVGITRVIGNVLTIASLPLALAFGSRVSIIYSVENKSGEPQSACLLYTSPSPRDRQKSRMPSSA